MSGRGKMPVQTKRRRRQPRPPAVQPTAPPAVQPTAPPFSHPTPPAVTPTTGVDFTMMPTPGYVPSGQFELGSSSYRRQEPVLQQPSQEEVDREEEEEDVDEEGQDGHDQGSREYQMDADGKVIIRPIGRGWTPAGAATDAMRRALRAQFRSDHHSWTVTPQEVKDFWWDKFREKVTWDPRHHDTIYKTFQQRFKKRLSDTLGKARTKGKKPDWMGDEAWDGLLTYWQSPAFLALSTQNKTNRASTKGGAVHTTGRRPHHEVALDMAETHSGPVDPAEFFKVTHQRKSGAWVDSRSQRTYEEYRERLSQMQTQVGDTSTGEMQEVDGARKLELWRDIAGGKSRGRCYGTADLSLNIRRGVSSLTQESRAPTSGSQDGEVVALRGAIVRAEQEAATAREEAATARQETATLQDQFRTVIERLTALERDRGRRHPDYDDDLDERSLDETSSHARHR